MEKSARTQAQPNVTHVHPQPSAGGRNASSERDRS